MSYLTSVKGTDASTKVRAILLAQRRHMIIPALMSHDYDRARAQLLRITDVRRVTPILARGALNVFESCEHRLLL